MKEDQVYKTPELEYDSEGFVRSFNIDTADPKQLYDFYHKYGIIVFRDVLGKEEIEKTIDDLWNSTSKYYKQIRNKVIDRNNPETWGQLRGFQKAYGFVNDSILEEPQIWENRRNPTVYKCFKRGYQANIGKPLTEPLIASFDRGSLMLPGKINKDWKTHDIYHFDIDPWLWTGHTKSFYPKYDYDPDRLSLLLGEGNYDPFVGYTKLAGVLALSDTNEDSGGFECALGFQNHIKQWCEQNQSYISIRSDTNLVNNFRKVFVRKGSLMIFSRELPHNIYENNSVNFRYAQYLRMSPLSSLCLDPELTKARKALVRLILPKNMDVSDPISKEVFMLDDSDKDEVKNQEVKNQEIKKAQAKVVQPPPIKKLHNQLEHKQAPNSHNSNRKSSRMDCSIQ